ncbi:high molecular mass nuclear protein [Cyclospora cayetanensis]|uniref:High molecular mass nuclear protein n=1 Tax=Cyclospora cayetanensis TaxID=88456 RepID=A0A1D3CYM4_9EIME|nr:high molecular mass nuclear protein [Cyclospora cayetanensis]
MTILGCGDICPSSRRQAVKRLPFTSTMRPVLYADTGAALAPGLHSVYPLSSSFHPGAPTGTHSAMYHCNYVGAPQRQGMVSSNSLIEANGTNQRTYAPMLTSGQYALSSEEPVDVTYISNAYGARGGAGKLVEPRVVHSLEVPKAGTQSRGKIKEEAIFPRATTSPVAVVSEDAGGSYQRDWQEEVRCLQKMLNTRDTQLELKEAEIQDLSSKLNELRKSQAAEKGIDVMDGQEQAVELTTMRKQVEVLRHERQELIELLLQKERQAAALDSVDPTTKEASAVQLGVQAISMVQGSAELREKLRAAEAEIKTLRQERTDADHLQQDTFDKLTDKRREAAELLELLSQRDMKVARVEAYLQQKTRELEHYTARAKDRLQREQTKREEAEQELLVAAEQCAAFKATVASRDEKIVELHGEVVRRDTLLRQLEERVRVLSDDLKTAHAQLQQALKGMMTRDAYMQALETQVRKSDAERQVAYLTEVSKSRKLELDTRMQQEYCRAALNDKCEKLATVKQDLLRSQSAMERIRKAITAVEEPEGCHSRSAALQSSAPHSHSTVPVEIPSSVVTDIPGIPLEQSLRSLDADFLVRPSPPECPSTDSKSRPGATSSNQPQITSMAYQSTSKTDQSAGKLLSASSKSPTSIPGASMNACKPSLDQLNPQYPVVRSDVVDQGVARVLEQPEYRPLATHICRLGPGAYLCFMQEVTMELQKDGNVVVKQPGDVSVAWTGQDVPILLQGTVSHQME